MSSPQWLWKSLQLARQRNTIAVEVLVHSPQPRVQGPYMVYSGLFGQTLRARSDLVLQHAMVCTPGRHLENTAHVAASPHAGRREIASIV